MRYVIGLLLASMLALPVRAAAMVLLFLGGLVGCTSQEGTQTALPVGDRAPNIVFIMADDLGYAHLGSYGQEKIRTPNLDELARQGMRFTQAYSGSPVCAPARSTLLTGTHQGHTSVRGNSGGVSLLDEDVTIGEVLQEAGYITGGFGKWGVGDIGTAGVPWKQGFDRFFGYLHQVHAHFYYPYFLWDNDMKHYLRDNVSGQEQYANDVIMEHAMEFVRENKDHRFFLYVPTTIPHTELLVPEDSYDEYEGQFSEPAPYASSNNHYADQEHPRTTFAAMITRMDGDVGRLMDLLDELGLSDDTIVIFTSDNGGQGSGGPDAEFFAANGPLRGVKRQVYEGGVRVPAIVRWPGRVEAGTVNEHAWYFPDVMPTLAEISGAPMPEGIDGISFLPALLGENATRAQEEHDYMYWEHPDWRTGMLAQAVRMETWKAVRSGMEAPLELYDLATDVGESNDIAAEHPDVVKRIEDFLATARVEAREYDPEPGTAGWPRRYTGYVIE